MKWAVPLLLLLPACGDEPDWPDDIPPMPACIGERGCHVIDRWTDADGAARSTFIAVSRVDRLPGMECGNAQTIVEGVAVIVLLRGAGFEVWRHEVMHTRGWTHDDMPAHVDRCGR